MTYIVIEMQTTNGTTSVGQPEAYTNRNAAENRYHTILAYAATSNVEEHTVVILAQDGTLVRKECYRHQAEETEES